MAIVPPLDAAETRFEMLASRRELLPSIDAARCTGCGWCVAACPFHLLSLEPKGWTKLSVLGDEAACTGCRKCEIRCPFNVITMVEKKHPAETGGC